MIIQRLIFILLLVASVPTSVMAQVSINGFASAGFGILNGDIEEGQIAEGGYIDQLEAGPITKFAIQTKAQVNERTSVTGQFIALGDEDFDTRAEWAYISFDVTDATTARFGRLRAPLFMYSDFLDVGYAYPWIRPPIDLYRLPFTAVEGIDIINQHSLGDWSGNFQVYYGSLEEESVINNIPTAMDLTDYAGVNYVLSNDWLSLRLSYNTTTFSFSSPPDIEPLFAGLQVAADNFTDLGLTAFAADINQLLDLLVAEEEEGDFVGVGLTVDWRDWLIAAEWTAIQLGEQSFVSEDTAWYGMLGRRFGDVTIHVTHSVQEGDPDFTISNLIPSIGDANLEALRAGTNSALLDEDDTISMVGLRYDYNVSTAFKFEVARVEQLQDEIEGTTITFAIDIVF